MISNSNSSESSTIQGGITLEELSDKLRRVRFGDNEWNNLHSWANDYIKTKKISKKYFVEEILHFPSFYINFMYPNGLKIPPSTKMETNGKQFREAIKYFQSSDPDVQYPLDLPSILLEYPRSIGSKKIEVISNVKIVEDRILLSVAVIGNHLQLSEEAEKQQIINDLRDYITNFTDDTFNIAIINWNVVYEM